VPGYADAVTAGLTPARPSRPPSILPGMTAQQAMVRCLVLEVATVFVPVIVGLVTDMRPIGLLLGAGAAGVVAVLFAIGRFRRILLAELAAGYVTTTFHQGMFWFVDRPGARWGNDVVGWVWDGVWVLTSAGTVVSAPDPDVEPPGMYPSPNRPGQLELWTGTQWIGVYADPQGPPGSF